MRVKKQERMPTNGPLLICSSYVVDMDGYLYEYIGIVM